MSRPVIAKQTIRSVIQLFAAVAFFLFAFTGTAPAQPPPGYYNTVDTTNATTLRTTLHNIIDDHTRFPYTSTAIDTWNILEAADEDPHNSNNILDVYKNESIQKFGGGTGPYQREHTWPKSYGFPDDGTQNYPYTDCHHLFLCAGSYNASRSNKPYRTCSASCTEKPTDLNNGQGGGSGTYPGNSNWTEGQFTTGTWETWIGRRGDVARALFYMDVRYEGGTHGITGATDPPVFTYCPESVRFVVEDPSGLPHSSTAWATFVASISATVTDDTDPNPQLTNNAPDPLPVGNVATVVTFTATDAAGNSSTCVVVVRVNQH